MSLLFCVVVGKHLTHCLQQVVIIFQRGTWEEFTNAPNRLDELDNEIHNMQARAEVLFQVDEQVTLALSTATYNNNNCPLIADTEVNTSNLCYYLVIFSQIKVISWRFTCRSQVSDLLWTGCDRKLGLFLS